MSFYLALQAVAQRTTGRILFSNSRLNVLIKIHTRTQPVPRQNFIIVRISTRSPRENTVPRCPTEELANNHFYTTTCQGFVRINMYGKTLNSLNAEVDKLLENAKAQQKASDLCEIRSFYINATSHLFMKMPDLTQDLSKIENRNFSFWIADLQGKEGFIPFPPFSEWTFLGNGFARSEFVKMTAEKMIERKAICGPIHWYYRQNEAVSCFSQLTRNAFLGVSVRTIRSYCLEESGR
ncbi:hypothetical protein L596_010148 [Steinernema carpocapsae]|uniref:Uncharacterized protein n=1 Tax=Steinernema carpocapsae TaxID=34508 RepID=A0A4U5PIS4_STECR|nr:hypothetical protein L596_010148 [Steinernema carpocapsae]